LALLTVVRRRLDAGPGEAGCRLVEPARIFVFGRERAVGLDRLVFGFAIVMSSREP